MGNKMWGAPLPRFCLLKLVHKWFGVKVNSTLATFTNDAKLFRILKNKSRL